MGANVTQQGSDLSVGEFFSHLRAVNKTSQLENDPQLEQLAADYAHATASANFLLAGWELPPELRAFVDALVGVAGERVKRAEWFGANDETISRHMGRSVKTVQRDRKEYLAWAQHEKCSIIEIEDHYYDRDSGETAPHRYRLHLARLAAEAALDARSSRHWRTNPGVALEDAAATVRKAHPVGKIHTTRKRPARADAESRIRSNLNFAQTKIERALEMHDATGGHAEISLQQIHDLEAALEKLKQAAGLSSTYKEEVLDRETGEGGGQNVHYPPPETVKSVIYGKSSITTGPGMSEILIADDPDELMRVPAFARAFREMEEGPP
jgi:hypothetical protein